MTTLFSHVTAVTMDGPVLRDAFVSVADGKIDAVGTAPLPGTFDRVIDARDKVLLPGLVNAHTHIPMTLMRGYAGGHDLQTWLNDYIFPAEDRLDGRAVRAGASLALAELIASGITAIGDMYYFCDDIAQAVAQSGINANLCRCVTCFAPQERPEDFLSCREMREFHDKWHGYGNGQILVDVSLHAEYTSYACPAPATRSAAMPITRYPSAMAQCIPVTNQTMQRSAPRMVTAQRLCTLASISKYTGPHSSALPTGI